jgi:hypothetical protein
MYTGIHVKYPLFLSDFNETCIFLTVFAKYSNTKFHENLLNRRIVVACGQTYGRTDIAILTVAFRNFANAPKNRKLSVHLDTAAEVQ